MINRSHNFVKQPGLSDRVLLMHSVINQIVTSYAFQIITSYAKYYAWGESS